MTGVVEFAGIVGFELLRARGRVRKVAGSLLIAVAHVPLRGGLAVEAIGLVAAIGALAILTLTARRA